MLLHSYDLPRAHLCYMQLMSSVDVICYIHEKPPSQHGDVHEDFTLRRQQYPLIIYAVYVHYSDLKIT